MKDDLKELKDCFTIHCLGEIDEKSYNFLIKKIERLENKALNMHIVGCTLKDNKIPTYENWLYFNFIKGEGETYENKHDGSIIDECWLVSEYESFKEDL